MANKVAEVLLTENFERNLDDVDRFLTTLGDTQAFRRLLDTLFEDVIPNLERFPSIGRPLALRRAMSAKTRIASEAVKQQASRVVGDGEIREYILPSYLVLYAFSPRRVFLLAIRHHRQLSYDLHSLWIR